jgi:hypothetical protein
VSTLIPVQLGGDNNPIRVEFFLVEPPPSKGGRLLVMKFSGVYGVGCEGNPDAAYMSAMSAAAVDYWQPEGTVLDLSELQYDWGDLIETALGPREGHAPHAVVVGPKSRRALATLMFGLDTTKDATDHEGYFDNLDVAIAYVIAQMGNIATETLHVHPPWSPVLSPRQQAQVDAEEARWRRLAQPRSRSVEPPVTEAQWLVGDDVPKLLRWAAWGMPAAEPGWTGDWSHITPALERRLLLFSCACLRRIEHVMDPRSRRMIGVAERFADGQATAAERDEAWQAAREAVWQLGDEGTEADRSWERPIARAANAAMSFDRMEMAASYAVKAFPPEQHDAERRIQADLLRDIFGNPFRPPLTSDSRFRAGEVVRLARAIYDDRAFARFAELADALARRGCTDETILTHLRHAAPHARGCHVLDLVIRDG